VTGKAFDYFWAQ